MERVNWSEELNVAVRIVHMACFLCQRVQENLVSTNGDQVKSKDDDSLVTIAGNVSFNFKFILLFYLGVFVFKLWNVVK